MRLHNTRILLAATLLSAALMISACKADLSISEGDGRDARCKAGGGDCLEPLGDEPVAPEKVPAPAPVTPSAPGPILPKFTLAGPTDLTTYPLAFVVTVDGTGAVSDLSAAQVETEGFASPVIEVKKTAERSFTVSVHALNRAGAFKVRIKRNDAAANSLLEFSGNVAVVGSYPLAVSVTRASEPQPATKNFADIPVPSDWAFRVRVENLYPGPLANIGSTGDGIYLSQALKPSLDPAEVFESDLVVELLPSQLTRTLVVSVGAEQVHQFVVSATNPKLPLVWMDASDTSTVFTDRACATIVTEADQPVGCWKSKGTVEAAVVALNDASLLSWLEDTAMNGSPAVRFDRRSLNSTTIIRQDLGPVHSFVTASRQNTAAVGGWQRILSFGAWGQCANDKDEPCVATWGSSGGATTTYPPEVSEFHYDSGRKLINFNMGRNSVFNSEHFEGEVGEALVFGDAIDHEGLLAVRARLHRLIKSTANLVFPPTYFD